MHHIFVSYKSEEQSRIQPLIGLLEAEGWDVWWDRRIPPGRTWPEVIEENMEAAGCVVVVWTEKSVASRWVRIEANEAMRRNLLVPVLLDDVLPPLEFRLMEAAKLVGWEGERENPEVALLLEAVRRKLERGEGAATVRRKGARGQEEEKPQAPAEADAIRDAEATPDPALAGEVECQVEQEVTPQDLEGEVQEPRRGVGEGAWFEADLVAQIQRQFKDEDGGDVADETKPGTENQESEALGQLNRLFSD